MLSDGVIKHLSRPTDFTLEVGLYLGNEHFDRILEGGCEKRKRHAPNYKKVPQETATQQTHDSWCG